MLKRFAPHIMLVLITVVLTTLFQPLGYLKTFAQQQPGCQTFKETGHTLCGKFLTYWQQHGGLAQQGFPISEPFNEKSDLNGQTYQVQYFERAVFEAHPENPAPNDVLLSQLGTFQARSKYGNPPQFPGAPAATPVPPPSVGDKITLARQGVTIYLESLDFGERCMGAGASATWIFRIENKSSAPITLITDKASFAMTDNTGHKYQTYKEDCQFSHIWEYNHLTNTLSPGQSVPAGVSFSSDNTPAGVTYFDIALSISGQALTFRYPLK